jgi:hypothetical protein
VRYFRNCGIAKNGRHGNCHDYQHLIEQAATIVPPTLGTFVRRIGVVGVVVTASTYACCGVVDRRCPVGENCCLLVVAHVMDLDEST